MALASQHKDESTAKSLRSVPRSLSTPPPFHRCNRCGGRLSDAELMPLEPRFDRATTRLNLSPGTTTI
jgi:hypothetical protein